MAKTSKTENTLLGTLGFAPTKQRDTWVFASEPNTNDDWHISDVVVSERKTHIAIQSANLVINKSTIYQQLSSLTKKYFGNKVKSDFVLSDDEIVCLFEFSEPGSRERQRGYVDLDSRGLPQGLGGFRVQLNFDGPNLILFFSDFFGIGHVSSTLVSSSHRFIGDALGLLHGSSRESSYRSLSMYEATCHILEPLFSQLRGDKQKQKFIQQFVEKVIGDVEDSKSQRRSALNLTRETNDDSWTIVIEEAQGRGSSFLSNFSAVPIQVLESREKANIIGEVDRQILSGKLTQAADSLADLLKVNSSGLHLLRRACLIELSGTRGLMDHPIDVGGKNQDLLFLSWNIRLAQIGDKNTELLALLSQFGRKLLDEVASNRDLKILDLVLPELLGDAWRSSNIRAAEKCYRRILQRRGAVPRVLRKLIDLARSVGENGEEEVHILVLADVERRKVEQSKLYYRLAQLRQMGSDIEQAIEYGLKSMECDPYNVESALLLMDLFSEAGRGDESIQIVDTMLKDPGANFSNRQRARLESGIARIWSALERDDLAAPRFERALALDPENLEALRELEFAHRRSKNYHGVFEILTRIFSSLEREKDLPALSECLDKLESIAAEVNQNQKLFDFFVRVLEVGCVEAGELQRVMSWDLQDQQWQTVYSRFMKNIGSDSNSASGELFILLGQFAQYKLQNKSTALGHYIQAIELGIVTDASFEFVLQKLTDDNNYELLARTLQLRLAQVNGAEKLSILSELSQLPEVLSEEQRDQYAVDAYGIDTTQDGLLRQRFSYYQTIDDVSGIHRLVQNIETLQDLSSFVLVGWQEYAINLLQNCFDSDRFGVMDHMYRSLLVNSEDPEPMLKSAIEALKECNDNKLLSYYIERMIDMDRLPLMSREHVIDALRGKELKIARFELLSAETEQDEILAASYARSAAALYETIGGMDTQVFSALVRLGMVAACSDDDLIRLTGLAEKLDSTENLVQVYDRQILLESETGRKYDLTKKLGELYRNKLSRPDLAIECYRSAMDYATSQYRLKWHIAELAREADDPDTEVSALVSYIADQESVADLARLDQATKRLQEINGPLDQVQHAIEQKIETAFSAGDRILATQLSKVLIDHNIASPQLYASAFEAATKENDVELAASIWWKGIAAATSRTAAQEYVENSRPVVDRYGGTGVLVECFKMGLIQGIRAKVDARIYQEYLLQYALVLFDIEGRRRKALVVFLEVNQLAPAETRAWMPLYFLLTEFGNKKQRLDHLKSIIGPLENDPRPLRSFPITIESLKAEFEELEAQESGSMPTGSFHPDITQVTGLRTIAGSDHMGGAEEALESGAQSFGPPGTSQVVAKSPVNEQQPEMQLEPMQMVAGEPAMDLSAASPAVTIGEVDQPSFGSVEDFAGTMLLETPSQEDVVAAPEARKFGAANEGVSLDVELQPAVSPGVGAVETSNDAGNEGLSFDLSGGSEEPDSEVSVIADMDLMTNIADVNLLAGQQEKEIDQSPSLDALDLASESAGPTASAFDDQEVSVIVELGDGDFTEAHEMDASVVDDGGMDQSFDLGGYGPGPEVHGQSEQSAQDVPSMDQNAESESAGFEPTPLDLKEMSPPEVDGFTPSIPDDLPSMGDEPDIENSGDDGLNLPPIDIMEGAQDLEPVKDDSDAEVGLVVAEESGDDGFPPPPETAGGSGHFQLSMNENEKAHTNAASSVELAAALGMDDGGDDPVPEVSSPSFPAPDESGEAETAMVDSAQNIVDSNETDSDSSTSGTGQLVARFQQESSHRGQPMDWRLMVKSGEVPEGMTQKLITQAFTNELEKHIAIQAFAVLEANVGILNNWHLRVWRKTNEYTYDLSYKRRIPSSLKLEILDSSLARLNQCLIPLYVQMFSHRFTTEYLARKLKTSEATIESTRQPISWTEGYLADAGFPRFAKVLERGRFQIFDMPGLSNKVFYEGRHRSFYIDYKYYSQQPISHLFHRILGILWSVKRQYFIPLTLNPKRDVLPIMAEMAESLSASGITKIKTAFKGKSRVLKAANNMDLKEAKALFSKVGIPKPEHVNQLWFAMQMEVYLVRLAETLDLVGLLESMTDRDFLKEGHLKPSEIMNLNPYAKYIFDAATKLVLSSLTT